MNHAYPDCGAQKWPSYQWANDITGEQLYQNHTTLSKKPAPRRPHRLHLPQPGSISLSSQQFPNQILFRSQALTGKVGRPDPQRVRCCLGSSAEVLWLQVVEEWLQAQLLRSTKPTLPAKTD